MRKRILAAKTTPSATAQTAAAKPKADSARRQQKKPEQVQSSTLLSDCRRFPGFAESNAEKRTYMSHDATLAEVMRGLNRAVLAFGVASPESVVFAELAGMVALLNYAAAFYIDFADRIESYMQHRFGNLFVDHYFRTVYCNRASYIEKEEFSSEGCPQAKSDPEARKTRRHTIETSFTKMVPDVTELRDGVQTVLFTFTWINYIAYRGYDAAMTATLHSVIPLLQTIIVRCARQMYLMQRALTAAQSISAISKVQAPKALDLQWDLLDLSAALQNLSGGDLALFTSDRYERGAEYFRKKRSKKRERGCIEKVVSCPYSAHLYTSAVADIALRTLLQMHKAIHTGTFSKPPIKHSEKCNDRCTCTSFEDSITPIIDGLYKRLTLIERKQYDWKPLMVQGKRVKKAKRKSDTATASGVAIKGQGQKTKNDNVDKEMMLRDILSKRIDEFDTPNTMLKGPSDYAYFTDAPLLSKGSVSGSAANKKASSTTQTTTSTSADNVVTTTKTVKSGSTTITSRTSDTGGSVSLSIASSALPESMQQKLLSELRKKPASFSGSQAEWIATMAGPFASTTEPDFTKNPAYQAFRMALGELPVSADVPSCLTEAEKEAWLEGSFEGLFEALYDPPGLEEDYHSWAAGSGFDGIDD
uniref:Uncharacterized protein n=1 Tax=Kalmanozyma brasiliensis (strain GHG001) TaxID=1365824 RepID=V5ESE2_KALBG